MAKYKQARARTLPREVGNRNASIYTGAPWVRKSREKTSNRPTFDAFQQRLEQETELLRGLFAERAFDNSTRLLGYELELCLADRDGHPSRVNTEVLEIARPTRCSPPNWRASTWS